MKNTTKTLLVIIIVSQVAFSLSWWNNNWEHRRELTIHSENNQTQEEIFELNLNTKKLIEKGKLNQDCSDLRIVNQREPLSLHITNCNTNKTNIYAEINITNQTPEGKTHLYYGYPRAESTSTKFSIGHEDEFQDGEMNTHAWETETRKWYSCIHPCVVSGDPSDDTTLIEEKQDHMKIYTKAQTNIYSGSMRQTPKDHAKATLKSKLPILNNVTDEAYYYLEHNLGTSGENSKGASKAYLTDGSTTEKIYKRYITEDAGMGWESAVYKLSYNKSKDTITLYRSELGLGHNSMAEEEYKNINKWKTGTLQNGGGYGEELSSVDASNLNKSNINIKFVSYSNAFRATGTSYTRKGKSHIQVYFLRNRVKGIKVNKSSEQTIPYLKARTSRINPTEEDFQGNYKIPIRIKNQGTFKATNLTLKPISVEGNLSRNKFKYLNPKETATVYLDQDINEPKTTKIRIEADSEENNQILFLDDEIAYFNQTTAPPTLNLSITSNNTEKTLKINKTLEFRSKNTLKIPNATYKAPEPQEVKCSSQGSQLEIHEVKENEFSFNLGTINGEKTVSCEYTLKPINANINVEEYREQDSDTPVEPLSPVNTQENIKTINKLNEPPYGSINKHLDFKYNYSANRDWEAKDPRSGEVEIKPNQTKTIQIELHKDNVITKNRKKRKQDPENTTEINGTAYTVIPIELNNTDSIKYHNVSWESTETHGWTAIKKDGTVNLESDEKKTIYLKQKKENVLTYKTDSWNIKSSNLSLQVWNTTAIINNTDEINYTSFSIPGTCRNQLNCTIKQENTLNPGKNKVEIQAEGDRIKNRWITKTLKPVRINQKTSKHMKMKTKSQYLFNFTNLSVQYKEEPQWNCTIHRNKVKALTQEKIYNISTCNGTNIIKMEEKYPARSKTPINLSTTKIQVNIPVKLNNTDPKSTYNVSIFSEDLNISRDNQTNQHTVEIKSNNTKETEVPFNVSVETEKESLDTGEFPKTQQDIVKISNAFSYHIKNLSFIQNKREDWKDISLYKCSGEKSLKCNTSNLSHWERVNYTIENGKIIRRGDSLSKIRYVTAYDVKESSEGDGGSGSSGSSSGGGSGGFIGSSSSLQTEEKKSNNETMENKTIKNETKDIGMTEKELKILEPVSEVNKSFKVKIRALNVKNCIIRIDASRWNQPIREGETLYRSYSNLKPGEHKLTVRCSSLEDSSIFTVSGHHENTTNSKIKTDSMVKSSTRSFELYLIVSLLFVALSISLYLFRNRFSLSWVRRRMGD